MEKVKLGIVGCGRVSDTHFNAINKNKKLFEIKAVCDINEKNLKKAADQTGAKPYTDLTEMLKKEDLDAITLATPTGLHAKQTIEVANHGVNVITEKPMAANYKEAKDMIKACKKNNAEFLLIYQNRLNPTIEMTRKAIEEGRFGKIYMILANVLWYRDQSYYDNIPWHGSRKKGGGTFFIQASHYADMMHWFANSNVKSIYSNLKTYERDINAEDSGSAIIEWKNGIIGNLNATVLTYKSDYKGSIVIIGEKGSVEIGGKALNKILRWEFKDSKKGEEEKVTSQNYETESVYGNGHIEFYEHAYDVLKKGTPPFVSMDFALTSFEMLDLIIRSNEKKAIIRK